ncbi:MAG: hypothetical protein FJ241_10995 [Nitrospira sp.]|nr:hypothetical protein [Nitrospira sp.]
MDRHKLIEEYAYHNYEVRAKNNISGDEWDDWFMAEIMVDMMMGLDNRINIQKETKSFSYTAEDEA